MNEVARAILRRHCRPLEPLASGETPRLARLPQARAALFDLYGTLFVSAIDGRAPDDDAAARAAFGEALASVGLDATTPTRREPGAGLATFQAVVDRHQAARREAGFASPEVDIVAVWAETIETLEQEGRLWPAPRGLDLERLAVEYEARRHPVWPMRGCRACLEELRRRGLLLGVVSNAQFYSPELFPALLGEVPEALGFHPRLQFYSYRFGWAKPATFLYERAAEALQELGLRPGQAIHVGNDPVEDVAPAAAIGFLTALFAGDGRSLRPEAAGGTGPAVAPDLVITDLGQLAPCLGPMPNDGG